VRYHGWLYLVVLDMSLRLGRRGEAVQEACKRAMDFSTDGMMISLVTGILGIALFRYGKKQERLPQLVGGIARMLSVLACSLAFATSALAEMLVAGAAVPQLHLADQYDVGSEVPGNARYVVLTRDMDAGKIVEEAFGRDGKQVLADAHAVYVSDISRMPFLVSKLFALPALRRRDYRSFLDRDGKATAALPSQESRVTVITIGDGVVKQIDYAGTVEALHGLLARK